MKKAVKTLKLTQSERNFTIWIAFSIDISHDNDFDINPQLNAIAI